MTTPFDAVYDRQNAARLEQTRAFLDKAERRDHRGIELLTNIYPQFIAFVNEHNYPFGMPRKIGRRKYVGYPLYGYTVHKGGATYEQPHVSILIDEQGKGSFVTDSVYYGYVNGKLPEELVGDKPYRLITPVDLESYHKMKIGVSGVDAHCQWVARMHRYMQAATNPAFADTKFTMDGFTFNNQDYENFKELYYAISLDDVELDMSLGAPLLLKGMEDGIRARKRDQEQGGAE